MHNSSSSPLRKLTPYEETQLARYGKKSQDAHHTSTPIEYITGKAEFCGHVFSVTPDVLIPRVETEELVALVTDFCKKRYTQTQKKLSIADVGTGSGAIAISLVAVLRKLDIPCAVLATDVSSSATAIATLNASQILKDHPELTIVTQSLLANTTHAFDCIVANLPYIPSERINFLDNSVKDHEPHLALDGGVDGLRLIAALLNQAETLLKTDGSIFLEIDHTHTQTSWQPFENWNINILEDSFRRSRFAKITKKNA